MNRGGLRGFGRGRGQGGRAGFQRDFGPPETVLEMGSCVHAVEDELLCSSTIADKVPFFNAPIYLQNKSVIGKVDEILGPINEVHFSIKMSEGVLASSFKKGDKVFIGGDKLLPIERFLPKPKVAGGASPLSVTKRGRGGGRGAPGGRGRGAPRGGLRGGRGGASRGFGGDRGGRGFSRGGGGNFSRGRGFRGGGGGRGGFRGS